MGELIFEIIVETIGAILPIKAWLCILGIIILIIIAAIVIRST